MKKSFLVVLILVALLVCLTACQSGYEFTPVAMPSSLNVSSNGGMAVSVGEYIYFINGSEDYTASNQYGEVTYGAIVRIKTEDIKALGDNEEFNYANAEMVVSKINYSASTKSTGLFVNADRLYFVSPNTDKDNKGAVQNNRLDVFSVKLDGSDLVKHITVDGTSLESHFATANDKVFFFNVVDETLNVADLSQQNVTLTAVSENVSSYLSVDNKGVVYFTKTVKENDVLGNEETKNYNLIYKLTLGQTFEEATLVVSGAKGDMYQEDVMFTLVTANENALFYTISSSALSYTGTYMYTTQSVLVSNTSHASLLPYQNGFLVFANSYVVYYDSQRQLTDAPVRLAYISTLTSMESIQGNYLYFSLEGTIKRMDITVFDKTGIMASEYENINITAPLTEANFKYDFVDNNDMQFMFFVHSSNRMTYCHSYNLSTPIDEDNNNEIYVGIDIEDNIIE